MHLILPILRDLGMRPMSTTRNAAHVRRRKIGTTAQRPEWSGTTTGSTVACVRGAAVTGMARVFNVFLAGRKIASLSATLEPPKDPPVIK